MPKFGSVRFKNLELDFRFGPGNLLNFELDRRFRFRRVRF
jgi:hypothetical protein